MATVNGFFTAEVFSTNGTEEHVINRAAKQVGAEICLESDMADMQNKPFIAQIIYYRGIPYAPVMVKLIINDGQKSR